MPASFVLGLLVSVAAAYLLLDTFLANDLTGPGRRLFLVSLAFGIATAIGSGCDFLSLLFIGSVQPAVIASQIAGMALLATTLVFFRGGSEATALQVHLPDTSALPIRLLMTAFVAAFVLTLAGSWAHYQCEPIGEWDAWLHWTLRARCLYRAGDESWQDAFAPPYWHLDYPLNVPLGVVRGWFLYGDEAGWIPWLQGCLFTCAAVGTLVGGVSLLRSPLQGLVGGLFLMAVTRFSRFGAAQYADIPVSVYMLGTIVLLCVAERRQSAWRLNLLAGLLAGMAAWTKNEGIVFCLIVVAFQFVRNLYQNGWKSSCRFAFWPACGAAIPLLIVGLFKSQIVAENDLLAGQGAESLSKLLDPSRNYLVLSSFVSEIGTISKVVLGMLPVYGMLVTRIGALRTGHIQLVAVLPACVMLAGEYFIYLLTPHVLQWHLNTSLDRLLLQMVPLTIFAVFCRLPTPEECWLATYSDTAGTVLHPIQQVEEMHRSGSPREVETAAGVLP